MNFRLPGPTPIPLLVQSALFEGFSNPIGHKSDDFKSLLKRTTSKLQSIFQTKNDLFILTCSGTGGMQTAISNFFSPGDCVFVPSCGVFGDRLYNLAKYNRLEVITLASSPNGQPIFVDLVEECLNTFHKIKAVIVVHNETSTGVANPLAKIASVVRKYNKLLIVDAISSLGGMPVHTDKWGLDVVVTASQKSLMCPPGLAIISVSPRAWEYCRQAKLQDFYFDLRKAQEAYNNEGVTPWTPNIPCIHALDAASDILLLQTLPLVFERHRELGKLTRMSAQNLGLKLFANRQYASDTVTAVEVPAKVDGTALRKTLKEKYRIVIANGQGNLKGKIFRIGHMGWCQPKEIEEVFQALKQILEG